MSENKATDYGLGADAKDLLGIVLLPLDLRREAVRKLILERHGPEFLVEMFAQFIGLANSVVANSHDALETFAIIQGGMHPYEAEKINFPTIFGALNGCVLADGIDDRGVCSGCAFRLGSMANQSPATTCDADWCGHPGEAPFMCHEDLDDRGDPTRGCAGFAQLRANRKAAA